MQECVIFHRNPEELPAVQNTSPNVYRGNFELKIRHEFNEFPGIITYDDINPTIHSPNSLYDLQF